VAQRKAILVHLPIASYRGSTLVELLVVIAIAALLVTGIPARAAGSAEPAPMEQTLAAIRECMAKSPAPWPEAWQREYLDTIRQIIASHQDAVQYAARLEIVRKGFLPYWEGLKKGQDRPLFEVHRAEIRWYVESLMTARVPIADDRQKLRDQYKDLVEYATNALLTQFPFLDPNRVRLAQTDHLRTCYRAIESPLLPTFLYPFTEAQIGQLKERWTKLRYARVDLWHQLGGGATTTPKKAQVPSGNGHSDYLLTQRSLDQLRGQIWSLIGAHPDYYRDAVAKEIAAQKQRLQSQAEARAQEGRLGVVVWQTEYLSFLLAALQETAESFPKEEE
jgi:hypothetical protein